MYKGVDLSVTATSLFAGLYYYATLLRPLSRRSKIFLHQFDVRDQRHAGCVTCSDQGLFVVTAAWTSQPPPNAKNTAHWSSASCA